VVKKRGGNSGCDKGKDSGRGRFESSTVELEANLCRKMVAFSLEEEATVPSGRNSAGNEEFVKLRVICLDSDQKEREDGLFANVSHFPLMNSSLVLSIRA
jgi:hypothetical protein